MVKGIYNNSEATFLTIKNFAEKISAMPTYSAVGAELLDTLNDGNITSAFPVLRRIAELAEDFQEYRVRRIALALSYSEEKEEDFASKEDLEWIPRVKEGLSSLGFESVEYQITEDATSFQEAWYFPGKRIHIEGYGDLLIGVDYNLEPRTATPIPQGKVALSVFFDRIVPDSKGTASKHILPLYLIIVDNNRLAVKTAIARLRLKVGFRNVEQKLINRFEYIKSTKA